jgi:hypothetical protein
MCICVVGVLHFAPVWGIELRDWCCDGAHFAAPEPKDVVCTWFVELLDTVSEQSLANICAPKKTTSTSTSTSKKQRQRQFNVSSTSVQRQFNVSSTSSTSVQRQLSTSVQRHLPPSLLHRFSSFPSLTTNIAIAIVVIIENNIMNFTLMFVKPSLSHVFLVAYFTKGFVGRT